MGRCNNRRVQQAAANARNTPARARFSKAPGPPPSKRNNSNNKAGRGVGGGGASKNSNNNKNQSSVEQQRRNDVVHKISSRVENKTTTAATAARRTASRSSPLAGVNVSKLDELTLPPKSIALITRLLQDLNVVVTNGDDEGSDSTTDEEQQGDQGVSVSGNENDDNDVESENDIDDNPRLFSSDPAPGNGGFGGYEEYENDEDEAYDATTTSAEYYAGGGTHLDNEPEWEGSNSNETKRSAGAVLDPALRSDHVFLYLTTQLSFTEAQAQRACLAVQTWSPANSVAAQDEAANCTTGKKNNSPSSSSSTSRQERLSHVMDWLCLHLSESDLELGFLPNPHAQEAKEAGRLLVGTGRTRAIPHPSISVAVKLTEDADWKRRTRLEERAVHFLKLGFAHKEIVEALEQTDPESDHTTCNALDDIKTLRVLLTVLEREAADTAETNSDIGAAAGEAADDEHCVVERDQEREALSAIYEDHFVVIDECSDDDATSSDSRYRIAVPAVGELEGSANCEVCDLHVFLRQGYPTRTAPLLLLHNPTLPWPLLRSINVEMMRQAVEGIGAPLLFEIVSNLAERLPEMLSEFHREQRAIGFEEEQLRLRKEAGHDVDVESFEIEGAALGRRQRAKLKAIAKAYDQDERQKRDDERRRKLQEDRIQRIKEDGKSIRQTMADKAILQRENERQEEELKAVSRSAMSSSFNRGETVEEARTAAKKAELDYRREHDMEISEDLLNALQITSGENEDDEHEHEHSNRKNEPLPTSTPTSTAFMDRLRKMYEDAASGKGGYRLSDPARNDVARDADVDVEFERRPCPIAAPVGDLQKILEYDVLAVQKDQPWLVAPEARAPHASNDDIKEQLSPPAELSEMQKKISAVLKQELTRSLKNPSKKVKEIRKQTRLLPAFEMREQILSTIRANQVTLISASTGAGKTTVVPSLLLNDMIERDVGYACNIWVTQPRRISAIGVCERISSERGEKVGGTCGYSIKLEKRTSKRTRITLCTTGILLRRLQCDPDLANVSHVIVDEVHERDINTDFLLIILKELIQRRKSLKLILMSATFDASKFAAYFQGCGHAAIPGRAHPVQEFRLEDVLQITGYEVEEGSDYAFKGSPNCERLSKSALKKRYLPKYNSKTIHSLSIVDESVINYELLAALIEHLTLHGEEGAILVFLPGMAEITNAIDEVKKKEHFQSDQVLIYPLHSSLSTAEQTQVFEVPPEGVRKIVFSSNIAETSITVSDILYVIDTGRVKELRRDEMKEAPALVECWVSRASAQQRRGRAGRVRPGYAYHLFSSHTYDMVIEEYQLPEISRVGIEDLVLQILILDLGSPCKFLAKALTPPSASAMKSSLTLLEELGAVECEWQDRIENVETETCAALSETSTELTPLGFHLATLPVEPRIGKLVIFGALFGCVEPALTIAAAMSLSRGPFVSSYDNRNLADKARKKFSVDDSDHLTILNAFNQYMRLRVSRGDRATNSFLRDNFLSRISLFQMQELRKQYASLLVDIGFLPTDFRLEGEKSAVHSGGRTSDSNANGNNMSLLKAVLCVGLYPNIIVAPRSLVDGTSKHEAGEMAFQSHKKGEVCLHPCTLSFSSRMLENRFVCYHDIMLTRKLYVRDATVVSPFALLLFGGALRVYHRLGVITVDEWLKFRIAAKPATLVKHLRAQMEALLLRKIVSPEDDIVSTPEATALIQSISTLLYHENEAKLRDASTNDGAEIVRPWHWNEGSGNGGGRSRSGRGGGRGRGSGRGGKRGTRRGGAGR